MLLVIELKLCSTMLAITVNIVLKGEVGGGGGGGGGGEKDELLRVTVC
jgi:hypothetical protein